MYMTKEQIDKRRDASKLKNGVPWTQWYDEMARKTLIRNLFKYLPVSIEMRDSLIKDSLAEEGMQDNSDAWNNAKDVTPQEPPTKAAQLVEQLQQ